MVLLAAAPLADGLLLDGLHDVGYTVCHQIPSHSFFIAGHQLPLCARCSGIYLGFLVGLLGLALLGRIRASKLPPDRVTALLVGFFLAMGVDGFNSLLGFFPDAPQIYPPSNLLRLATGMAAGVSLALLLVPMLNQSLWSKPEPVESVFDIQELGGYGVMAAMAIMAVNSTPPELLYPIAILSTLGVFVTLSMAATAFVAGLVPRRAKADSARAASRVLLAGFGLAVISMAAVGAVRSYLTPLLGLPG
jgi:uncharacterized membrane protein